MLQEPVVSTVWRSVNRILEWTTRFVFFVLSYDLMPLGRMRPDAAGMHHASKHLVSSRQWFDEHTLAHTMLGVLSGTTYGCCKSCKLYFIVILFANISLI